ncbi:hypothetical protein K438DRAFT_1748335 [Mycena galopus ATCC 62051]|nr:hypothetical protein K438DRAFT_1748335 [Mycena galopus ATCC 62051]
MSHPGVLLTAPLPADEVMCELFGIEGIIYRLSIMLYDPHVRTSGIVTLDRYQGSPADADAPVWTRRLPPGKFLRFPQPRAFATQLVAGMTDIALYIGTPAHRRIARHCKTVALRKIKVWVWGTNLRDLDLL